VTLESALPYLSIGCAIGAAAAAAVGSSPGVRKTLKTVALLSLAIFAFLRGVAPAALALALVLSGLAWAISTAAARRRAPASAVLFILAWLVLAWLCLREGVGETVLANPLRLVAAAAAVAAAGGLWLWRRRLSGGGEAWIVETVVLGLLVLASLTLRDSQWPAMAGALALFGAHALALAVEARPASGLTRPAEISVWVLSYVGQAAMAYVFLR
jgi:hypothetical protein